MKMFLVGFHLFVSCLWQYFCCLLFSFFLGPMPFSFIVLREDWAGMEVGRRRSFGGLYCVFVVYKCIYSRFAYLFVEVLRPTSHTAYVTRTYPEILKTAKSPV